MRPLLRERTCHFSIRKNNPYRYGLVRQFHAGKQKRGGLIRRVPIISHWATRAYSSSCFLPPIVFSLANTASTLRSSRCFSEGSNSGSLRVVSEAGSRVAPP